jgi:hypothetical protein
MLAFKQLFTFFKACCSIGQNVKVYNAGDWVGVPLAVPVGMCAVMTGQWGVKAC